MDTITRRRFLSHALPAAAAAGIPLVFTRRAPASWSVGSPVHPNVPDLRVVGLTDPAMTGKAQPRIDWAAQEKLVNAEAVAGNIDRLACALTGERRASEAWKAVFVKPPKKAWTETVVAIKTNNIAQQHTHSAVLARLCRVFTDGLGVKPENVHIYDACHGGNMARKTPFAGLPEGCRVEGKWGGSTVPVGVPAPWKGKATKCVAPLAKGSVDILVNVALCKGHNLRGVGGFTLTMKNHLGTFSPGPAHRDGLDYLLGLHRTPAVLGEIGAAGGKVLYPRQQLCLIDALWSSKSGPGGHPTAQTNFLAMGVFGPAVDYVIATRFRAAKMGWPINAEVAERILPAFGHDRRDLPEGGKIISP